MMTRVLFNITFLSMDHGCLFPILAQNEKRLHVIKHSSPASANQDHTTQALLSELLIAPLPAEDEPMRPVSLRSTATQRQLALKPFLQRTWVDHLLRQVEHVLVCLLLLLGGYWLLDGYGRDWLYTLRLADSTPSVQSASGWQAHHIAPASRAAVIEDTTDAADQPDVSHPARSLPFTTPDMVETAPIHDYIAPQAVTAPATVAEDLRPRRLLVPAIGIDSSVVEVFVVDGVWQVAEYAVGYHHGSGLPDQDGNTVMAGHAGLRGSVFRDLGQLQPGAEILVEAGGWQYRYHVREIKNVWPTQIEVMAPTSTPVLTLITCTAWDTQRLVVVADLVGSTPLF